MRILLVEDGRDLADLVARRMPDAVYAVDVARTRRQAEDLLRLNSYDVLCLDLTLPDGDGSDLCRSVRGAHADPGLHPPERIVMLTARDGVSDRVSGLDAGADDYLVKPFELRELLARLRAVIGRGAMRDAVLAVGDLQLHTAAHRVWRSGEEVRLTARGARHAPLLPSPPRRGDRHR